MAVRNKKDMGYLGEDFQYRLAHELITDHEFFKDLYDIIDQNMFTDPNLKTVVGVMKEHYAKYENVPSYAILKQHLFERSKNDIEREYYDEIVEKIHHTPTESAEYTRDLAVKFFKQQNIIKAANEILRIAGNGDVDHYDRCVEILTNTLNAGEREDLGSTPFENQDEVLSDDYRIAIPTGIGKIDETLEGGLGKGELGAIVGSSSFGKTSMTTAIAAYAATYKCEQNNGDGFKVLQLVFEDRIKQIQRKHFGRITGVEAKDLSKEQYLDYVKEQLKNYEDRDMLNNNLRIIRWPSGERSAWDVEKLIKKLRNNGFSPDLVIVDYFEWLAPKKGSLQKDDWSKEGENMRKFEAMAGEMNIAFWIPIQGTRDSVNAEIVTMDKAGGSFKKIQIAHIVMTIARTTEDIENNLATIAILKNRAGCSGKIFNNVEFNNGTCRISTDNVAEFDSMAMFNKKKKADEVEFQRAIFEEVRGQSKPKVSG